MLYVGAWFIAGHPAGVPKTPPPYTRKRAQGSNPILSAIAFVFNTLSRFYYLPDLNKP
jgi:hypothetical protein